MGFSFERSKFKKHPMHYIFFLVIIIEMHKDACTKAITTTSIQCANSYSFLYLLASGNQCGHVYLSTLHITAL